MSAWEIYFDMIFTYIWVNPCEYFFLGVEEDHVFVDDEVTVVKGESAASVGDCFGIEMTPL